MKNIKHEPKTIVNRLNKITIKEIIDKYPDKYVETYAEGKNAVLVLDTCRIKFINTKTKEE
tara:strand:- start:800 stop:982 length:183 start_codon:yes stop_codon:yes gene_type:complete